MGRVIETSSGRIEGTTLEGIETFLGVPFAETPRLRPPLPTRWPGVRPATEFGTTARQSVAAIPTLLPRARQPASPERLCLNIWTPGCDFARRPVMVWIHGGGFMQGSGNDPTYGGHTLARRGDLVVVTINYRLGMGGFFYHPALEAGKAGHCGNWGILDQLAALRWVHENIERFGGDPYQTTLFGGSAGGISVGLLATSPLRGDLFRRAIIQSGAPETTAPEDAIRASEIVLREAGVSAKEPAKMRELSDDDLDRLEAPWLAMIRRLPFGPRPVGDGRAVVADPAALAATGATAPLDLLLGTNRDEYKLFGMTDPKRGTLTHAELRERLLEFLSPARADRAIGLYQTIRQARREPVHPWELWCALQTDRTVRVPALRFAEEHVAGGSAAFSYLFTWQSPFGDGDLGACHGLELPFVFGTHALTPDFAGASREAEELADHVQDAWIAFARSGHPTHPGIVPWPRFTLPRRSTCVLDDEIHTENAPREPERVFWEEVREEGTR